MCTQVTVQGFVRVLLVACLLWLFAGIEICCDSVYFSVRKFARTHVLLEEVLTFNEIFCNVVCVTELIFVQKIRQLYNADDHC